VGVIGFFLGVGVILASTLGGSDSNAAAQSNFVRGKLLWSDEFTGKAGSEPNSSFWTGNIGNYNVSSITTRSPDLSQMDGSKQGILNIQSVKINDPSLYSGICGGGKFCQFKAGEISTRNLVTFRYGYIEARMKMPLGLGNTPAFWLLRDGNYVPNNQLQGEIDVVEWYGNYPNESWSTLHFEAGGVNSLPSANPSSSPKPENIPSTATSAGTTGVAATSLSDAFHTYGIAWLPDSITFYLDGKALSTYSADQIAKWPFNNFYYLILNGGVGPQPNTIYGGNWDGWHHSTLSVDWVRAWKLNGFGQVVKRTLPNMTPAQMLAQLK